jgi:UDP-GlcNAc:undecaprenyl-phosphate GlcNAc-1-phosphate transferase
LSIGILSSKLKIGEYGLMLPETYHSHQNVKKMLLNKAALGYLSIFVYLLPLLVFVFILRYYIQTRYNHFIFSLNEYFVPAFFSFLLVLILIPICMKTARKLGIQDAKSEKNKFSPVPLLGGVGVFIAFLIVMSFYEPWTSQMKAIVIASSIIVIVGTIDDIKSLASIVRLFAQILAGSIVIMAGLKVSFFPHTWWGEILAVITTMTWILGIVNATNFADGADGLATGFTVISSFFFFLIALHLDAFDIALISSIVIGAGLGFLIFNFKPAKVYLGDGGSTFLGFLLACLSLYGGWSKWNGFIAVGIPVLILSVLIFDMIYITVSRIKNGHVHNFKQWLDYRGQDHFHHRLMHLGFKEEAAVVFIYATSIIMGLSALVIAHAKVSFPVTVLAIQAVMIFINIVILMLIGRRRFPNAKR